MKKSLKSALLIALILLLFPISKAYAASHTLYTRSLSFTSASKQRYYYISPGNTKYIGTTFPFHSVTDGNVQYLAYCLHDGRSAPAAGGSVYSGFSGLTNKSGQVLSASQQEILQNILAAGYQYTGNVSEKLSSASAYEKNRILATQLLVWEVMNGGRTNYSKNPNNLANNTYTFVSSDPSLKQAYENIVADAEYLTNAKKPASFRDAPYIMHWNDGSNSYESPSIDIGRYRVNTVTGVQANQNTSTNKISFTSKNPITQKLEVTFSYLIGNSSSSAKTFKWFQFSSNASARQAVTLAYYQGSNSAKLYLKTEQGKFKLMKVDSLNNAKILGAVFDMYKCSNTTGNCESKPTATIDLTEKTESDDIVLNKQGIYLFKESKVPYGYEKLQDFYVSFKIDDNGNTTVAIDPSYNFIKFDKTNGVLSISNEQKSISINKIDGRTNASVNGATFQVKNSSGNILKFDKIGDKFVYSQNGAITDISISNKNTYQLSLIPQGEYSLVETNVPYPYVISSNQIERETKFKIDGNAELSVYNSTTNKYEKSSNATITVKNFKTKVTLKKIGNKSTPLEGVVFELYNSDKSKQIAVKAMSNGEYDYNTDQSTPIQLITNSKGEIVVNYLPEGTYYFKEVKAVDGYVIDPSVEWTKIKVTVTKNDATDKLVVDVPNAKGTFCFYKMDEDGNYLTDGKFKVQYYNEKNAKYEDVTLIYNKEDNNFTIDSTGKSDIYIFNPLANGETCFVDINAKGKYRVVEIEAPEGFVLPKSSEAQAELTINENGYANGTPIIINKKVTTGEGAEAQAELIINISTGQNRVHYIIIISILLGAIALLFVLKNKINKK